MCCNRCRKYLGEWDYNSLTIILNISLPSPKVHISNTRLICTVCTIFYATDIVYNLNHSLVYLRVRSGYGYGIVRTAYCSSILFLLLYARHIDRLPLSTDDSGRSNRTRAFSVTARIPLASLAIIHRFD